jgi:hypothetical protein
LEVLPSGRTPLQSESLRSSLRGREPLLSDGFNEVKVCENGSFYEERYLWEEFSVEIKFGFSNLSGERYCRLHDSGRYISPVDGANESDPLCHAVESVGKSNKFTQDDSEVVEAINKAGR